MERVGRLCYVLLLLRLVVVLLQERVHAVAPLDHHLQTPGRRLVWNPDWNWKAACLNNRQGWEIDVWIEIKGKSRENLQR